MVEIKNMLRQLQSPSSGQPAVMGWGGIEFTNNTRALSAPGLANYYNAIALLSSIEKFVRNNRNIALQGQICYTCFSCWVDPIFNNEEGMRSLVKIKPPSHTCDPKKLEDLQKNIQDIQDKKNKLSNDLINILLQLIIVICFGFSQMRALYLKAEELV
ncbi:MAG: hypothetical protein M3Y53_07010 [Thermoproteota archaeon]|nr:hypothetical protein [Thermoproteota archaeon]